jgi:hypothetical protein
MAIQSCSRNWCRDLYGTSAERRLSWDTKVRGGTSGLPQSVHNKCEVHECSRGLRSHRGTGGSVPSKG